MRVVALAGFMTLMFSVAACKKPATSASTTKDLGTVASGIEAVAVYQPVADRTWKKAAVAIRPGATVWTVDGTDGRPKYYQAHSSSGLRLKLVETVFRNSGEEGWERGYVLVHCFDWDKTKHISADVVEGAVSAQAETESTGPALQGSRKPMCGL